MYFSWVIGRNDFTQFKSFKKILTLFLTILEYHVGHKSNPQIKLLIKGFPMNLTKSLVENYDPICSLVRVI